MYRVKLYLGPTPDMLIFSGVFDGEQVLAIVEDDAGDLLASFSIGTGRSILSGVIEDSEGDGEES